jgi:hypothetical protein
MTPRYLKAVVNFHHLLTLVKKSGILPKEEIQQLEEDLFHLKLYVRVPIKKVAGSSEGS